MGRGRSAAWADDLEPRAGARTLWSLRLDRAPYSGEGDCPGPALVDFEPEKLDRLLRAVANRLLGQRGTR
jgi:hypothetical protein